MPIHASTGNMTILLVIIFVGGYFAIAMEQPLRVNKAASALITGVLCWTVYMIFSRAESSDQEKELYHHLGSISSILFFLLGAMTIVELIDMHSGFDVITRRITTRRKSALLLIVTGITFVMSALLDNLTTSIIMVSLCRKMLPGRNDRLWFAGMVVIAANAGGVWSPLGDVTTTMLWIGRQVTALHIMRTLLLPSLTVCILPALLVSFRLRGQLLEKVAPSDCTAAEKKDGRVMLFIGLGLLVFVPLFTSVTGLPPFMGMLLALGLMWVLTTTLHKQKTFRDAERFTVARALEKIDTASILFFLGILLAISALEAAGILRNVSALLDRGLHNDYMIGCALGLLSSVVDNVPLVAASQGMYSLSAYPTDHSFWEFLALATGTGGSMIIIGSAAGVAVMGIEQVPFGWYLKKISWLAFAGFAAGALVFSLQQLLH